MKGDKEIVGTLRGFDDYVNMVMDVAWLAVYGCLSLGRGEVPVVLAHCGLLRTCESTLSLPRARRSHTWSRQTGLRLHFSNMVGRCNIDAIFNLQIEKAVETHAHVVDVNFMPGYFSMAITSRCWQPQLSGGDIRITPQALRCLD